MEQDAEIRAGFRYSSEIAVGDETVDELEETGGYMEIDTEGKGDKEMTRESGKHRSKDRKKGRREEMDRGSRDRERGKEREKEDHKSKDSDKHVARGRDQLESNRERRKEDRSEPGKEREHEKDRDKEGSSDKLWEKERDLDRGKHRGKERGRDKELDRERERSHDQENEWGRDRGKDRGRDWEKEREAERERGLSREYERAKERDKVHDHGRDRDKDRDRDRDKGNDRSKIRERDHEKEMDKELGRERGKERGHERGKERERESEKDRGRAKDRGREKEKIKDREKEKEKEKDRDRDKLERERNRDTSRARDRERRETSRGKEEEHDERVKVNGEISRVVKKREGAQDEGVTHDKIGSKDHNEKAMGSQSTTELQDRLIKMKEERLKRKSDGDSEILSWVSKSRVLEEKRNAEKEKAARLSKALEEQDNILAESEDEEATDLSAKDLAGVKILHGLDKVIEGGAVVLTLKDQNILADGDINEEVDMLENVEIGQQKQRDAAYKAAKKKTGIYDDKFGDDTGKTMLPQYDDPIEDEGVTLDEGGRFTGEAEKKLDELRRRLEGGSTSKNFEDLTSSGKISSDYFTPDEMLQFKKPRKKKSLRKKDKLDLDALEAEAISTGLGTGDLGSRNDLKRQSAKEEQEKTEAERRSNAYKSAYAKAEEASKALRQEQTSFKAVEDDNLVFGEDYDDLQRSLEQARKLALKRQDGEAVSVPQAVALLAVANKEQGDTQSPTRGDPQENKVVVTEMEEFVLGLQLNEEGPKLESEDVFKDEEVMSKPLEHETKADESGWTEVQESNKDELPINEEKEDIAPDEIIHEVPVGKGLAGAFKLLKERGTLNEGIDWGGRNMDKKKSKLVGIHENDGPKEIHIERTDEFGRIMTPKEAFRVISHKFHGKGPGKMKQEKRMKQYQEDLKTKQMKASDTPSQSMERMREAQARLKTPYLVLSGHVKPGQTSDPRSGFATVEKDHLGSLTPMLGDKKVEHFLGIKRKPESGSMGPPPPKKFKS